MCRVAWYKKVVEDFDIAHATEEQVRRVFDKRDINENVWHGRAYVPYDAGDWDAVLKAEPSYLRLAPGRQRYLHKLVNQRPGLVMQRHTFGGKRQLMAQLRPFKLNDLDVDPFFFTMLYEGAEDEGVHSQDYKHDHNAPEYHIHEVVDGEVVGLVATTPSGTPKPGKGKRLTANARKWRDRRVAEHLGKDHRGLHNFDAHPHQPYMVKHIAKEHGGNFITGEHLNTEYARYLYPPGEEANIVDVHPDAWHLLRRGGQVVYWAMEGLLKNDAILSTGAPVVNCGSVTLWDDPALPYLARRYLSRFDTTVVVPDSDWAGNRLVLSQARQLQQRLQDLGLQSVVAAPPATCGPVCEHMTRGGDAEDLYGELPSEEHKTGVDDFRGDGGDLQDMIVKTEVAQAVAPKLLQRRAERFERNTKVLEYLRQVAADDGLVIASQRTIGAAVGRDHKRVAEALVDLEHEGLLTREDSRRWAKAQRADRRAMTAVRIPQDLVPQRELTTLGQYLSDR
jgi:hypothetical protein